MKSVRLVVADLGNAKILPYESRVRYPPAREAIKALMSFGKYHYIETGSLLGIKENVGRKIQ